MQNISKKWGDFLILISLILYSPFFIKIIFGPGIINSSNKNIDTEKVFTDGLFGILILTAIISVSLIVTYFVFMTKKRVIILFMWPILLFISISVLLEGISDTMREIGFKLSVDFFGTTGSAMWLTGMVGFLSLFFVAKSKSKNWIFVFFMGSVIMFSVFFFSLRDKAEFISTHRIKYQCNKTYQCVLKSDWNCGDKQIEKYGELCKNNLGSILLNDDSKYSNKDKSRLNDWVDGAFVSRNVLENSDTIKNIYNTDVNLNKDQPDIKRQLQVQPYVKLVYPPSINTGGNTEWTLGNRYTISWDAVSATGNIYIYLNFSNGGMCKIGLSKIEQKSFSFILDGKCSQLPVDITPGEYYNVVLVTNMNNIGDESINVMIR